MEKDIEQKFENIDRKFDELLLTIKDGFDDISGRLDKVESRLDKAEENVFELKNDMKIVKSTMVTKDFVSEKNADLGVEIGRRINSYYIQQKTFAKKLVEFLQVDGALKQEHVKELEEMLV